MSTSSRKNHKMAIVHDFITYFGGAEQVLKSIHDIYPDAPIYTLLFEEKMRKFFPNARVKSSFLNKLPGFARKNKKYLIPFFSTAAETLDLRDFDVVISSSNSFVKGVITKPKTIHICYCHAPTRFLWDWHFNYLNENKLSGLKKMFILPTLHYLRMWDKSAAERVDYFIANSRNTSDKIKKFYGRESVVIYPPVDIGNMTTDSNSVEAKEIKKETEGYFLIVSRLSGYKRIDLAVEAFNKLELPLVVVGEGEEKKRLEKMAGKNIKFAGFQDEEKLAEYYKNCQAFIFPGEDDFGMSAVEAMSFGKPVLAYRKGGALETVVEGVTGEFFDDPIPEILADGIRRIKNNRSNYDAEKIKEHARKFSKEEFEKKVKEFISSVTAK